MNEQDIIFLLTTFCFQGRVVTFVAKQYGTKAIGFSEVNDDEVPDGTGHGSDLPITDEDENDQGVVFALPGLCGKKIKEVCGYAVSTHTQICLAFTIVSGPCFLFSSPLGGAFHLLSAMG